MGDSGLVPLASGWVSLIWGVSFSSSGVVSSARFPIFPGIGVNLLFLLQDPCQLPFPMLLHLLLLVHPLGDFFLSALLSHLIFDWPVFPVFSSFTTLPSVLPRLLLVQILSATSQTVSLLSLSYHTTTSQLWWLFSRLTHPLSPFLVSPPFFKEPSPLSQAMIPPQNHPTPSEGV
jgi:hypothetical protein